MGVLLQFPRIMPVKRHARVDSESDNSIYTSDQAARLAKVHPSTLAYWVGAGVVTPSRTLVDEAGQIVAEGYSFEDLGYLRVLRYLRVQGVPLHDAVEALVPLMERFGPPSPKWRTARVYVYGKRVYSEQPDGYGVTHVRDGGSQRLEETFFGDLFKRLRDRADSVLIPPEYLDDVEIDPHVASGMPVVRETRVPTAVIRELADTMKPTAIIKRFYPFLTIHQIKSAVGYERYLDRREVRAV